MFTLIGVLCSVGLINPTGIIAGFQRERERLDLSTGPTSAPPEDGDRIQSPEHHVSNKRQDNR
jgi:hypothetical protein